MTKVLGTDLGAVIADYELAVATTDCPLAVKILDATIDFRISDVFFRAAEAQLLAASWFGTDPADRLGGVIARVVTTHAPDIEGGGA